MKIITSFPFDDFVLSDKKQSRYSIKEGNCTLYLKNLEKKKENFMLVEEPFQFFSVIIISLSCLLGIYHYKAKYPAGQRNYDPLFFFNAGPS